MRSILPGPRIPGTESMNAGSGLRILSCEPDDRTGPLAPETAFRDPEKLGGKLDGAIMELRALERRVEFTGIGIGRLPSIKVALCFLRIASGVDAARCLRAVTKGMTEWKTNAVVKLQMRDLFAALDGRPEAAASDDEG